MLFAPAFALGLLMAQLAGSNLRLPAISVAILIVLSWCVIYQSNEQLPWTELISSWQDWQHGHVVPRLPYTQPNSPSDRFSKSAGLAVGWLVGKGFRLLAWSSTAVFSSLLVMWTGTVLLGPRCFAITAAACLALQCQVILHWASPTSSRLHHAGSVGAVTVLLVLAAVLGYAIA